MDLIQPATAAKPLPLTGPLPLECFGKPGSPGLPTNVGMKLGFTHASDAYRIICNAANAVKQPRLVLTKFGIVRFTILFQKYDLIY